MTKARSIGQTSYGKARSKRPARKQGGPSGKLIALVVFAAVVVVGGFVAFMSVQSAPPSQVKNLGGSGTTKGSPDAKVSIVEYSDFQCPYCAQYALGAARQIDQAYVATGKVKATYKNRAVIGPESNFAGEAALCAADQDRFWEYHDKIFASQNGENKGAFAKPMLKRFASELGLDTGAFNNCVDSGKYASQVRSETAESEAKGVKATPTFFINGLKVEGSLPFSEFQKVIDSELRKVE